MRLGSLADLGLGRSCPPSSCTEGANTVDLTVSCTMFVNERGGERAEVHTETKRQRGEKESETERGAHTVAHTGGGSDRD